MPKFSTLFKLLLPCASFLFYHRATAQEWKPMPPYGGIIRSALSLNNDLLVGTDAGIYKSTDGGISFKEHSKVIPTGSIKEMVEIDGSIFACIRDLGIYKSIDGGIRWSIVLPGQFIVGGYQPIISFGDTLVVRGVNDSIYISEDKGNSWRAKHIKTTIYYKLHGANRQLFSYSNQSRLGPQTGLYRSEDLGSTWIFSADGLPPNEFISLVVSYGDTLYSLGKYFYRSLDKGETWTQSTTDSTIAGRLLQPEWVGRNGRTIYGHRGGNAQLVIGQWTPGDAGWQLVHTGIPLSGQMERFYNHQGTIYISRFEGNYKKTNSSTDWTAFEQEGIHGLSVADISVNGKEIFAISTPNILRATDLSPAWNLSNPPSILDNYPFINISPTDSGLVLGYSALGIYRTQFSQNAGNSWSVIPRNAMNLVPTNAAFLNLGDTLVIYGGAETAKCVLVNPKGSQLIDINDGLFGNSFSERVTDITKHGNYLYASITSNRVPRNSVICRFQPGVSTAWVRRTGAIDGKAFGTFAIGSFQNQLVISPMTGGVKMSSDEGLTWFNRSNGLNNAVANNFLSIGDTLYAATNKGVFRLASPDTTWQDLSFNLPCSDIKKVILSDNIIWSLVSNGGVWRFPRGNYAIPLKSEIPAIQKGSIRIFPNPADNTLYIMSLQVEHGTICVRDLQGKELIQASYSGQSRQVALPIQQLIPGMYIVELQTTNGRETARFVKQ